MNTSEKSVKPGAHYIRSLLSYLTILAIPLILISYFYSFRFLKHYYKEVYETVDMELMQVSSQFENQVNLMESIVGQLALSGLVQQTTNAKSAIQLNPIISNLSMYTTANPFIEDIILIPDDREFVVTSSTTCDKSYFYSRIFTVAGYQEDKLEESMQSKTKQIIPNQKVVNLGVSNLAEPSVLFLYPLYTDFNKKVGTALFHIRTSSITNLISQRLLSYQAQIAILNGENTIIVELPENEMLDQLLIQRTVAIDMNDYLVRSYTSDDWSYFAVIKDSTSSFSQADALMQEFIITIIGILVLSAVIILFIQKINYKPMELLNSKARSLSPIYKSRDEVANISNALDFLSEQNSSLSIKLKNSLSAVQNERINRLISSRYASKEDFNMDCSELDMELLEDYFTACLFLIHTTIESARSIVDNLKVLFSDFYVLFGLHTFNKNQLVLLFNLPEGRDFPYSLLEEAQHLLATNYNLETTIGVGSKVHGTLTVSQSYLEAVRAAEYRFVRGNNTIITIKEVMEAQQTNFIYPHKEFETLRNALLSRNVADVRQRINDIINVMEKNQLPLYLVRSICFDLIHLVNDYNHDSHAENPIELSGLETASEIIHRIIQWSDGIDKIAEEERKIALDEVYEFLKQNCLRCDFSVYETAEFFGMTLPTFSRYFKNATGRNVIEYTLSYRISAAKLLLGTTSLPLKDIAERVGYYNMSSFTRRFKLETGTTPSDYRKMQENRRSPEFSNGLQQRDRKKT